MAFAPGKGVIAQMSARDVLGVYAALRMDLSWSAALDGASTATIHNEIKRHYGGWAPELRAIVDLPVKTGAPITVRPLYALPSGFRWPTHPRVTLVGDAAHVMTPFAGMGVNLALQDAVELARRLIQAADDDSTGENEASDAIQAYESEMTIRAAAFARETEHNCAAAFADDAPASFVAIFEHN